MSNYITVENGIFKRDIPDKPLVVGFENNKGLKYITTLDNGKFKERVEFFGVPVTGATEFNSETWDMARQRDIEAIYSQPIQHNIQYAEPLTIEHIRDAMDYAFYNRRYNETGSLQDYPGINNSTFNLVIPPIESNPLTGLTVAHNPILDGDNWSYEVQAYPLTPDQVYETLPDSVTIVEDISADEALRRGLITDIQYLDIISREDDNI